MSRLADYVRDRRDGTAAEPNSNGIIGLLRVLQSEPQRQALDNLLVLGTLLEGHADHVMDAVGPAVVPTVATIRGRFDERRQHRQPPLQRLVRALLGFDAKISQYTRGKAFVDEVVSRVGMQRFNAIWSGPDTLPLPDEVESPGDGSNGSCSRSSAGRYRRSRCATRLTKSIGVWRFPAALTRWH